MAAQLEDLMRHPVLVAHYQSELAKIEQERIQRADALKAAKEANLKEIADFKIAQAKLEAKTKKAQEAFRAAEQELSVLMRDRAVARLKFDRLRDKTEAYLRDSAPSEIDTFIRRWRGHIEEACHWHHVTEIRHKPNPFTGQAKTEFVSNRAELDAYIAAVREMVKQAEALKQQPGINVAEALQALEESLPKFEKPNR